ncbi:hypothetical protein [Deinococcus hopiensis]|uniref:Uncharacterized protein n=1 Tax=Deinococcus hopiensis KR-140 TaxID=695939 RepID=A0A1W1UK13_9DEIO|nr:hypothetical protein [Deinococcus hopiensis]SMB81084.1 hypothetical protein SAMN00790413_04456 [Deinococcus hopiensis KR-140]
MTETAFQAQGVEEDLRTETSSQFNRKRVHGSVYPLYGQTGAIGASALIPGSYQGCYAYASDMRVTTADRRTYYSPDVMVISSRIMPSSK